MPSKELKKIISRWQDWLTLQRNCSEHTIQSYLSDLYIFLVNSLLTLSSFLARLYRDIHNFFKLFFQKIR